VQLWAVGVGAAISGFYFGWQTGLLTGGFGGLLLATILISGMYVCLVLSVAELSAALPNAGGFYIFTWAAFGKDRAFLNGITDAIEYITTPAVIVAGIAGYMKVLFPLSPDWAWWVIFYGLFVLVNILGVQLAFRVSMGITALATGVLFLFYGGALTTGAFHWTNVMNVPVGAGGSAFLPKGWFGIFAALPYATWFYLGVEQLPLCAEETHNVERDIPRALQWSIGTLLVLALVTLVLNSGVSGGAQAVGESAAPLELGFRAVFPSKATAALLAASSLAGLIASFHSIIYAYGRLLFALGRAGYLPPAVSKLGHWRTPHWSLLLGGAVGLLLCFLAQQYAGTVGAALLNMAVFGALISYILVLVSYLRLKRSRPQMRRPYVSPLGSAGAAFGIVLAVGCLGATFVVPAFRPGVAGTAVFIAIMLAYYWLYRRHHVKSYE
jgi:ethanolamine permease